MKIETALVSVYDKEGVVELGRRLAEMGVRILSTGGTARALEDAGVPVVAACYGYCDLPRGDMGADAAIDSFAELIPALQKL